MPILTPSGDRQRDDWLTWAELRLPVEPFAFNRETSYPLAVTQADHVVAVVVYHEWRGRNIELSFAADTPRWATRGSVSAILSWPFKILRVRRITTITASLNQRAIRLNEGLGFQHEGAMRDAFEDDDAVIMGLTRADFERSKWHRAKEA